MTLYALLGDGTRIPARFDDRQRDDSRLSSVQYLKFNTASRVPVAVGIDFAGLRLQSALSDETREALRCDLLT